MRRMGDSVDWIREYFTMDDKLSSGGHRHLREACIRAGPDLPRQAPGELGPKLQSAVSDLEVENEEKTARCGIIAYPARRWFAAADGGTTRPETMLGDVAVMVHPEDERYTNT